MLPDSTNDVNQIGKRIECMGEYGTVKYVGTVEAHPSVWLGIDWDNPDRGKHNGTVNGKVYFIATFPKSGSFVRPEKVHFGQSAVEALMSRYGGRDEIAKKLTEQQLLSVQKTINAPFLQMVGFDKINDQQRNYSSLQVVNIRNQNVSYIQDATTLQSLCPNLRELDISKNLIHNWSTIFEICAELKQLKWLNVSENIVTFPDKCDVQFPNISVLICGKMKLNWCNVLKLSEIFPNIEELRVPHNSITNLEAPKEDSFYNLQLLDLENNRIEEWSEILKLCHIPLLNHLILENIGLKSIYFPPNCDMEHCFSKLSRLVLTENKIDSWESISELNKLKSIEDLRIIKNPVLETFDYNTCIQLFFARIANLKLLNGSDIRAAERKGAEYDYLKKYGIEWLQVRNTDKQEDFLQRHNRYLELIEIYGTPEECELKIESNIIKESLLNVNIVHNQKTVTKKLPPTLLIQKLIMLVQRLFNLSERPNLVYLSGDIEIELNDEGKELGFYSIQSGDKIIVNTN